MNNLPRNVTDILERISEAFVSLDKNWCYTYMNRKAGEIFNRDPAKMIGRHIWTEFPEGIGQPFHQAYEKAMVEQKYFFLEEYYPPYDKWFENHIYPSPDGLSIFFLDITKRKKTEHFNEKVQKEFDALINSTSDLLWSVSRDYTLIATNKTFIIALKENGGYEIKPGDTVLSPVHFPEEYLQYWKKFYDKGLSGESVLTEVYAAQAHSSELLWFELKVEPIKDEDGVTGIVCSMRNITERKKAEDVIKKEKELSDSIINSLPGIFYMSDTTPKLLRWNKALEIFSGYSSEELGKIRPISLFVPEDHAALKHAMEKAYKEGFGEAETQLVNKNGERVPFYFTGVGIEHDGKPAMLGTGINISDRKKADTALKKSIERFELMAETSNDALWEWNLETNELWANKMHQHLYGLSPSDPVPFEKEWEQRIHPDDRERIRAMKNEAHASTKKLWDSEYRFQTRDKGYIDIYDRSYIVRNEKGKPIRIMGSMVDITQRKKNEKMLAENENYLRTILQTEPECVKILGPNGELLYMNPAGLAMIEADNEEQVSNQNIYELVDIKYRSAFKNMTKKIFEGNSERLEFEITGLRGSHRWLETHAVPLKDAQGSITSLLGITRDITQKKIAEDKIKTNNDELRRLTAHLLSIREEERQRIGREIHDDLGQQLTAIKMDVAWLEKRIQDQPQVIHDKFHNIITLLNSSNQSVRNILNELRPSILGDFSLIDALKWQGNQFNTNTGIHIEIISDEEFPQLPEETGTCIYRVFQEALTNITRYANAKNVKVSTHVNENNISVTIQDDGVGFEYSQLKRKKTFGILGMKERVRSLGGNLDVVSSQGKGTIINFSLPRVQ
jgi:PAS domain S-box-containing protein